MLQKLIWQLLLQIFLIFINAIFACAEIAVLTMSQNKLEKLSQTGDKRAARLIRLTSKPAKFLATIQVGITFAGFLASAFAADNFSDYLVNWLIGIGIKIPTQTLDTISVIIITVILSYFTLVFGELVPKRFAMNSSEKLALKMSWLITSISRIFSPIVWLLTVSTNGILRLLKINPKMDDSKNTEEEIRLMVEAAGNDGHIDNNEREMIQNIFKFDDITAADIMTHRLDVDVLWLEEIDQWQDIIISSKHSFYPVCNENIDNIMGVLNIKHYFFLKDRSKENIAEKAIKPPYFVPETVHTDVLFYNMKKSRQHFAIVLDERGGFSGIVTLNDLLEQLVGDIDDLDDKNTVSRIQKIDDNKWIVRGDVSLADVAQELDIDLPIDDIETFSGYVLGLIGYIPDDGTVMKVMDRDIIIKTDKIKDHNIIVATVEKVQKNLT